MVHSAQRSLRFILLLICGLFIYYPLDIKAQKIDSTASNNLDILRAQTDILLGADDELINGKIYIEENLLAEGNPYFLNSEWMKGGVRVNGLEHGGLFLKYNIYTDELVLKAERKRGEGASVIALNNEFVESFYLNDRHFVNSMYFDVKGIQTDFVELLYEGNFTFFVSYSKSYNNDYNLKTPFGSYGKTSTAYFISQNGKLSYISSKKALYNYFEPFKKQINKFLKKNKIKYAKASYEQLHNLMQFCDELSQE